MKQELDIFIVAYQRPEVLLYTLQSLYLYITESEKFNINLYIWINDSTDTDTEVCAWALRYKPKAIDKLMFFPTEENKGKAYALNYLYDDYSGPDHLILVLDQDMVFKDKFIPIIEDAIKIRFDILGFASTGYWAHIPARENSSSIIWGEYDLYYTMFIAGGIMLLRGEFLANNRWTNEDGVYGGDDYNMCANTNDKFILELYTDWLDHDPMGPHMLSLKEYYAKKSAYTDKGQYVLPKGWYKE